VRVIVIGEGRIVGVVAVVVRLQRVLLSAMAVPPLPGVAVLVRVRVIVHVRVVMRVDKAGVRMRVPMQVRVLMAVLVAMFVAHAVPSWRSVGARPPTVI
jgi:hypothetical protein